MATVTVHAEHAERWWVITCPEVPGLVSQARRFEEIDAQVRDALRLLPEAGVDADTVEVVVVTTHSGLR